MIVWPFKPREEVIEALEWNTDVLQSRGEEQRIALRTVPRRVFNLDHVLTDLPYSHARALIRANQGAEGFWLPDWTQAVYVGELEASSAPRIDVADDLDIGDYAVVWESDTRYEVVEVEADSGGYALDALTNSYQRAYFLPAVAAQCPEGISVDRGPGSARYKTTSLSLSFVCAQGRDLAEPVAASYRGFDVLDACPVAGDGQLEESLAWPLSEFDNGQNAPHYIRERNLPNMGYQMRWHVFTREEKFALKQWLYWRRGRQRAFWMSSRARDLEPAAAVGAVDLVISVFAFPELVGLGRTEAFDIEVKARSGQSLYRRVTGLTGGAPVAGRATVDMAIDASLGQALQLADIARISFLRCTRLDVDRVELLHRAGAGMAVSVPCIEVQPYDL